MIVLSIYFRNEFVALLIVTSCRPFNNHESVYLVEIRTKYSIFDKNNHFEQLIHLLNATNTTNDPVVCVHDRLAEVGFIVHPCVC